MAVNFNDETWKYVEALCEDSMKRQISLCIQPDTTWEQVLQARGQILALKGILNQPLNAQTLAANKRGNTSNG